MSSLKEIAQYEYLRISDLQKITSKKLHRLTRRPLIITERSRPKYVVLPMDSSTLHDGDYQYLTARPHPWKKQLYIKGRNMTAATLVGTMKKEKMTVDEAADDFNLPIEAILEALHYFERAKKMIELEALEEKRRLQDKGLLRVA